MRQSWGNWGGQALALAQTILARYLSRPGYWARLRLIFKADPIGQPTQTWLNLAPRLALKLAFSTYRPVQPVDRAPRPHPLQRIYSSAAVPHLDRPAARSGVRQPMPEPAGQRLVHRLRTREVIEPVSTQRQLIQHFISRERLSHHLLTRGQRIEVVGPVQDTTRRSSTLGSARSLPLELEPGASLPKVRPVPRIMHRPASARIEAARHPAAAATKASVEPFSPPAPALNLNQLTDQVVQAIDRRIIAQRERLGRI